MRHTLTTLAGAALLAAATSLSQGQTPIAQIGAGHTNLVLKLAPQETLAHQRSNQLVFNLAWTAAQNAKGLIHIRWIPGPVHAAEPTFSTLLTAGGGIHVVKPQNGFSTAMLQSLENNTGSAKTYSAKITAHTASTGTSFTGGVSDFWNFPVSAGEITGHAEIVVAGTGLALTRVDAKMLPAPTLFLVR